MTTSTQGSSASPDFSAINSWTQSDYNLLTSTLILSMTDTQLQAMLHPEWVPVSVFTDLPAATLNKFSATQFQALTPDQLNQIPTTTLTGVTGDHLAALTAAQVAGFTHITALTPAQFGQLNLTAVAATTMSSWSQAVWSGLTAAQVSLMSLPQINSFQHASWLPLAAASGLLPTQVSTLSGNYGQFTAAWLNQLRPETLQALNASRLNTITAATWAQLDNTRLAALTAAQVGGMKNLGSLSSTQFGLLNISGMSTTTLGALTAIQYAGLTPSQMSSLSLSQINVLNLNNVPLSALPGISVITLNAISVNVLDNAHLAALTPDQIRGCTTLASLNDTQLAALSLPGLSASVLNQYAGYSDAQIAALTQSQVASLLAAQVLTLSAEQVQSMPHPEWLAPPAVVGLSAAEVNALGNTITQCSAAWLNGLSLNALSGLTAGQLNALSPDLLSQLDNAHIAALSATQVSALDNTHLAALTAAQVGAMNNLSSLSSAQFGLLNLSQVTTTAVAAWSETQFKGLTAQQITTLSPAQIHAMWYPDYMPDAAAAGFNVAQFAAINDNFYNFDAGWFNALPVSVFQTITASRMNQLYVPDQQKIDAAHLSSLPAAVVAALTNLKDFAPSQIGALNLTALTITQIAALPDNVYEGLTLPQLLAFSGDQVAAMQHLERLSGDKLNALNTSFIQSMSSDQLAALTSQQLVYFDADHLAACTGSLTSLSDDAVIGIGSLMTASQFAALTDSQKTLINTAEQTEQALINSLSDAGLKTVMQGVVNEQRSVFDFIDIETVLKDFSTTLNGNLTASQVNDLRNYAASVGQVRGMDSSVYSLMNGMMNGADGASIDWTGDGGETRIGSLSTSTTATQYNNLVSSWFDGTNDPADSALSITMSKPLFAEGGPSIHDIHQGDLADCYLLGALQAVVNKSPDYIRSMVVENPNGSYSVRFFNNGVADWVTVDEMTYKSGAARGDSLAGNATWGPVFERAYLAFESTYKGDINKYTTLNGGYYGTLQQITGDKQDVYYASSYSQANWDTTVYTQLKAALQDGNVAEFGSRQSSKDAVNGKADFVSNHLFGILGYNSDRDTFTLSNPYSAAGNTSYNGTFEATIDQLFQIDSNGKGHGELAIAHTTGATGVAGQLVTAMASDSSPAFGASNVAPAQTSSISPNLAVSHA